MLEETLRVLPTPRERARKGLGYEDGLPNVVASLLPTPTTADGGRASATYGKGNLTLGGAAALLPTPRAGVDKEHGVDGKHWAELGPTIKSLLPSPTTKDSTGARNATAEAREGWSPGTTLSDLEFQWSGVSTRPLSDVGRRWSVERPSLSALFEEWMLGLPQGWSDPGCLLSAMEFSSSSENSPADDCSSLTGSDE